MSSRLSSRRLRAVSFALFAISTACTVLFAQPPAVRIQVDRNTGNVTIRARNAPISSILKALQDTAGIEVVIPELEDRSVTVNVRNQPLSAALSQILPRDTRFFIREAREQVLGPESTGDKPGRRTARRVDLPPKGAGVLPPINQSAPRKPSPEERLPIPKLEGEKRPPTVREMPDRLGAKIPKRTKESGRYARLRFTMTAQDISLREAVVLESQLVQDIGLLGEFIYALESGGRVLALGSFRDPLTLHSYFPNPQQPHAELRAVAGDFDVSIPGSALDPAVLASSRLVIYRLVGPPPDSNLTPETFGRFRNVLREVYSVSGAELARRLAGGD